MFVIYNLFLMAMYPVIVVYFLWRIFGSGKSKISWRQQLGFFPENIYRKSKDRPRIWIHAVSVGETVVSAPIFQQLRSMLPNAELIVSTTTTTGNEMAKKAIPDVDQVIYFPLDLPIVVRRALDAVSPDVFVCVESELWPNFLAAVHSRGIPVIMVNGIISDKTYRRGLAIRGLYSWALSNIDRFLIQTDADASRMISLGASPKSVEIAGNCKFDQADEELTPSEVDEMRRKYGLMNGSPVFVAGSTNPGEDEPVLDAFAAARKSHPKLKLIIAPRQIERADEISAMAEARGFSCGRRSNSESLTGIEDVVILDTFGELASVYGIGDVAFVGGSLIRKGGHNILQPIAHGKPVFFGPYTFKSRDLVAQAKAAGVGFEIRDGRELGACMSELLSDTSRLNDIAVRSAKMMSSNRGASKRCADAIRQALNGK